MNKRAGFAQPIIDAFATLVIMLILIVFFFLFSMFTSEREYKIKEQVSAVDGNIALMTFLRMPVDYYSEKITMAEVLQRVDFTEPRALERTFARDVKQRTLEFLSTYYEDTGCPIRMVFSTATTREEFKQLLRDPQKPCSEYKPYYQAQQLISRPDGTMVTVELYAGVIVAR